MALEDLIRRSRSYRRFCEGYKIDREILRDLVNLARLSPSSANLQPLRYILSFESSKNNLIFPTLAWAGYLKDWRGPEMTERPSGYIIILGDKNISSSFDYDCGIAAQSILLGATDRGLGGCMIGSVDRDLLRKNLKIPKDYEILLVIALGKPKEQVVIEDCVKGDIRYYRDKDNIHHVPKRSLEELILPI